MIPLHARFRVNGKFGHVFSGGLESLLDHLDLFANSGLYYDVENNTLGCFLKCDSYLPLGYSTSFYVHVAILERIRFVY